MENKFKSSLDRSIDWLLKTDHKIGGSSAHYNLFLGWSDPYPETTGYIIPTLINYGIKYDKKQAIKKALDFGNWLIDIQSDSGYWNGGTYPPSKINPSVFNTGQILFGMQSLYLYTKDNKWLNAGLKGANWLAEGVGSDGNWKDGHYNNFNPSYYSRVAWPMLIIANETNNEFIKGKALSVLDALLKKQNKNGTFDGWGFSEEKPAFTHTIAYTIRGFVESSLLLNDWELYGKPLEKTLENMYKLSELNMGRLAGAYNKDWDPINYYTCLTGNVQIALCLLRWHQYDSDLRLVNAASKLIEFVSDSQSNGSVLRSTKGAFAGSKPFWGKYMMFRYPNWAAKFYADAVMELLDCLNKEKEFEE